MKTKNPNKNNKNTSCHPIQQIIKLVFVGIVAVLVGGVYWLGRDFFSEAVNLNIYGFSKEIAIFIEGVYRWTPIILLVIYVIEFILVAVSLKRNINNYSNSSNLPNKIAVVHKRKIDKCTKICRIVCIVLAVIAILLSIVMNFAFGIFPKIVDHVIAFEEGADILELMKLIISGGFGLLIVQIIALALPLMTFEQEGWINVVTWLLLFIPGIGSTIAVIFIVVKFFSRVRIDDSDGDSYDVIIIKKH